MGGGGLNPCQDGLWHLFLGEMSMYKRAFAQFFPKIGATECPFECGGAQWLFGQCPNELLYFYVGASLKWSVTDWNRWELNVCHQTSIFCMMYSWLNFSTLKTRNDDIISTIFVALFITIKPKAENILATDGVQSYNCRQHHVARLSVAFLIVSQIMSSLSIKFHNNVASDSSFYSDSHQKVRK